MTSRNTATSPRAALSAAASMALIVMTASAGVAAAAGADDALLRRQAAETLRKASEFFCNRVATEGGYLWRYSEDLARREGEGKATASMVWVQPPGTPSVGMVFLEAYRATGEEYYREAARKAGHCLVRGQLRSGGWDYRIEFDPAQRKRYAYRVDAPDARARQRNSSTLDDDTTQAAVRLLVRLDQALGFGDAEIHEAAQSSLATLLAVQYPNGAWPQRFDAPPDPEKFPVLKASYPESWPRTWPGEKYAGYYTFNDNTIGDTIDVLFEAARVYGDPRYRRAAEKGGDFILLAQMPEPQPAWAQQYDAQMHPAWARKFEPPAVTGGESHGVMRTLLAVYRETGNRKYLEPIPRAIDYLRRSQLADGRLARFYELRTNKPLYFTRQYELTYSDADTPTHYAFKISSGLDRIEQEYRRLLAADPKELRPRAAPRPAAPSAGLAAQVKAVIAALDAQGRWVEEGRLRYHGPDDPARRIIDCQTFIRNVRILSAYLAAGKTETAPKPGKAAGDSRPRAGNRNPLQSPRVATRGPEVPPVTGTFSIVAADPESGVCGAAVASKYPAVGTVVPYVRPGVGAFCTQHWHNPAWGPRALDLLEQGKAPEEVLAELLRGDPNREKRQLAIVDVQGRAVNRNPSRPDPSGVWWGGATGRYYACQGNTLAGREVIEAIARAYEETKGSLADRLMAALVAADRAGGDHRGRLAAGIRVAKKGVPGCWLELQVDKSDDAVTELARKYAELRHDAKGARSGGQTPPQGFVTATFGNTAAAEHPGTLRIEGGVLRFDLASLPAGVPIERATLRFPFESSYGHWPVKLVPVGLSDRGLSAQPPDYRTLNAADAVRAWVARPDANRGLKIVAAGRADFPKAVLEVGYAGAVPQPLAAVSQLAAAHRDGQTFLTWKEPFDVVAKDEPAFEEFERAVLAARGKRQVSYRVYRHDQPITPANLGQAQFVREVPEALSCWNLLAIANTEHPQEGVTQRSPLREGNLRLAHPMSRYRLGDSSPPLARGTGLAVLTAKQPGRYYYAVTVAVDGREAVDALGAGQSLAEPVGESPATFPAIVYQRTRQPPGNDRQSPAVDVYVSWLEPPLVHKPRPVEVYLVRWPDLPPGSDAKRRPLYVNLGTYGSHATEMSDPGFHAARRYVPGAVTIALAEEGTLWAGDHECLGTLRGLDEGVVWNHEQRRVLAATAWAAQRRDLFVDPERLYVWGQAAGWALRHGELFAVVMSNGHNNFKTSREGRKHFWRFGLPEHSKNWLGTDHLDYLDLASWVRENPAVELPYWVCAPAYGAFPDHTLGDFGFKPWQEFIGAMKDTRRAFAAVWMSNGPGLVWGVWREMVPKITLHQSLPAFSNCSLDTSPMTDHPKGSYYPGRFDQDFQKYADKEGGINLYQRWDPEGLVDEPHRWAVTVWLAGPDEHGQYGSPAGSATSDVTPRWCRQFKPSPGERFRWTNTSLANGKLLQSGTAAADRWGLVTVPGAVVSRGKSRIEITKTEVLP